MKNIVIISLLLLSLSACSSNKKEECPVLKVSLEKENVSIMDLFDRLEVIALETNDSCLLIWPDKILYTKGCYEIFDAKHPALFVFDENGRFVRKVGAKGEGPEEYTEVYDVTSDDQNGNIYMLSPFGEIFVYTPDGNFIERRRLPQKSNYQSLESFGDYFAIWTLPGAEDEDGISLVAKSTLSNVKEYWRGNRELYSLYPRAFHKYEGNLYFFRPFDREVYNVCKDSMSIAYTWDFGKDNYSVEDLGFSKTASTEREEGTLLLKYLKDRTIPYLISAQNQTSRYYYSQLVFGFTPQGIHHVFYSKEDGKSFFFKETVEGIRLNPLLFNDDFILCLASNAELDSYKKALNETERKKLINRKEEDNPVLIKCYYK